MPTAIDMQRQGIAIDWDGFAGWLENKGLSKKHRGNMLSYGKKWAHLLFSGGLSQLEGISGRMQLQLQKVKK